MLDLRFNNNFLLKVDTHLLYGLRTVKIKELGWALLELDLLELMYDDLAKRSKSNLLERDTFLTFFHLNGLWGEEIFNSFDTNKSNTLELLEFRKGIETLIKGSYENKIHFLFAFYNTQKKNGVSYDSLLKMLYSYPKEELSSIIDDEKFLKNMEDHERQYHFGNKKSLDPLREVVELEPSSSLDEEPKERIRKHSQLYCAHAAEQSTQEDKVKDLRPWGKPILSPPRIIKKRSCSISFYNPINKAKVKMSSNITLLVKKYASFLFQEFNLDKDKDLLTESQFKQLIKKHQRIFLFYYQSFHNYIWEVDESNIPQFIRNTSWVEGPCQVVELKDKTTFNRYLRFYKTTIFVFRYKNDNVPIDIINMEGLFIEQCSNSNGFGFNVKHRDGIYPQNSYLFKTKTLQQQWLRNLTIFMKGSIYDSYMISEKIGAGKFSVVYKGFQKKNTSSVAIKVIEKFKFSLAQKQVIRQQVGILQLVHHPNIVTLIDKFQSKTTLYIVTELMGDGDLHDYVKSKIFLDQFETALILNDILHAIAYLNGLGIIHRDLKSQNIMVNVDKQTKLVEKAKIIDFGFAVYKSKLQNQTEKQRLVGTPNFVAPEILLGHQFDEKVDLFSLGVIMYFMLTGELPFDSIFVEEISKRTVDIDVYFDESHWMYISDDAKDLLSKLLTNKKTRLTVSQALKHPWIRHRDELKHRVSKSKKNKFI